ncbi:MAG: folate-binding protein YgfZ [Bdellovibrionales bacterium]
MDLLNRALIEVTGADRIAMLQKLVTQDLLVDAPAHYTLLLTPQGRYAFDFFVVLGWGGNSIFLDVPALQADGLAATLGKYKLRSDFVMKRVAPAALEISLDRPAGKLLLTYPDPRHPALGWRTWRAGERFSDSAPPAAYKKLLTECCIIEPSLELTPHDLPLEFGLDNAHAISFAKGCYVGQELTARTHHKGLVKHRILLVSDDRLHARDTPVANTDGAVIGAVVRSDPPLALVRVGKSAPVDGHVIISGQLVPTQSTLTTP